MSENVYWDDGTRVATQCEVSYRLTHSQLLGPDGKPLPYEPRKIGFQIGAKRNNDQQI